MANPQLENGYTKIADELLDAFCRLHLSGNEWSFLHALIRKTYGFNKKEDWITNSQISKMTGMGSTRVSEVKKSLISISIVMENRNKISLQKDYSQWGKLRKTVTKVTENRNSELRKTVYTKDTITKDNNGANARKDMGWKQYNENAHSDDLPAIDAESGEEIKPKVKEKRHYNDVYKLFVAGLGKPIPANWLVNKTQMQCADNLYTERGIEKIENALRYYKEHKDDEFCPQITSPYDLDSKWTKLFSFKQKNG